jgi:hypothetical protein
MERRRCEAEDREWKPVRRGWCFGEKSFRKELLAQMAERAGQSHYGDEIRESAKEMAERIVSEALRKLRWTEKDLEERRKGDVQKVRIARRLRRETTVTLKWIAERLRMGTWTHVANRLYHITK